MDWMLSPWLIWVGWFKLQLLHGVKWPIGESDDHLLLELLEGALLIEHLEDSPMQSTVGFQLFALEKWFKKLNFSQFFGIELSVINYNLSARLIAKIQITRRVCVQDFANSSQAVWLSLAQESWVRILEHILAQMWELFNLLLIWVSGPSKGSWNGECGHRNALDWTG